jgi:integrase
MKGCRPLSEKEVEQISGSFSGRNALRDKALFLLGVKSGFRISEILSLRVGDVVQAGRIVKRVAVHRRHMKRRIEGRTVLLHPAARTALQDWINQFRADSEPAAGTYIFSSRKGDNRPISRKHAWRILKQVFQAKGLTGKLGTHSMRKTFADRVYARLNQDLAKTRIALGHRNVNSTVSYLSFREEEIDQAILAI